MRRLPILICGAALAVMASGLVAAQPPTGRASLCGRHCLLAILWDYTEALTDNKPSEVPAAADVRVTSNGRQVELGRGDVWGSPRRIPYRQALVDPTTGAAIFYGVVTNAIRSRGAAASTAQSTDRWWFYVVRLKVERQRISEIEEVAYEGSSMGANAKALSLPDRVFDTMLPPDEQSSRRELIRIANEYFDAVSGKLDYRKVPWHPECERIELGVFTVNAVSSPGSCGGEFQNPAVRWNVVNRRFYVADVGRGIVLAVANFTTPPDLPHNNGSVVFELFKIQDGFIRQIQAFFRGNGQLHSGWGSGPGS
ncbi:MAG: hypothetical protein WBE92_10545 [Steroidobacteraceae bacterium]